MLGVSIFACPGQFPGICPEICYGQTVAYRRSFYWLQAKLCRSVGGGFWRLAAASLGTRWCGIGKAGVAFSESTVFFLAAIFSAGSSGIDSPAITWFSCCRFGAPSKVKGMADQAPGVVHFQPPRSVSGNMPGNMVWINRRMLAVYLLLQATQQR